MCGRFALTLPVDRLRELFGFRQLPNLTERWNIAPTQAVLAVRQEPDGPAAFPARWGLIPSWSKDPSIGAKLINARAETVREKPSFKTAFQRRRCLIPADSFYEWKTLHGIKQPYRIRFEDDGPFAFAGLWERWLGADGSDVDTCSIVTTDANEILSPLHHRMPVILDSNGFQTWLTGPQNDAADLMRPYQGPRRLTYYPISRKLNDVRNDDASVWEEAPLPMEPEPAAQPKKLADDQLSLF
ncbi:SOS response-associated peptidase [Rhodospirillaceae bacterium KN72]|uniref:Abasic site processing protein n=1 Tax=Pacificispira spongiicola TaxID=2729598 RepID=A0A7Y0HDW3_9PROT|nr:SOS response-associated peptidase [Pacificispira spongiicola]NMM42878.1 SOS response-associated peptidase [Pacificispira spongiicola]